MVRALWQEDVEEPMDDGWDEFFDDLWEAYLFGRDVSQMKTVVTTPEQMMWVRQVLGSRQREEKE